MHGLVAVAGLAWSLFSPSGAYAIDETKFAALDRAAKRMEKATASGVSRKKFGELALELAAELLAAKKRVQDDEDRQLLSLYAQVGLAYGDSLTLLREKADRGTSHVSASSPNVAPLISRYAIPIEDRAGADRVDCDSAIRLIWATASKALREARSRYAGRAEAKRSAIERRRALEEAQHQRMLMERVYDEFERSQRQADRPQPFESGTGNWTCPRGYVIRRGICLSDEEISRLPRVEMGR